MSKTIAQVQAELKTAKSEIEELKKDLASVVKEKDEEIATLKSEGGSATSVPVTPQDIADEIQGLKDQLADKDKEIEELKKQPAAPQETPSDGVSVVSEDMELLKDDLETAQRMVRSLQRQLETAKAQASGQPYELTRPQPGVPREYFDSERHGKQFGWLYHDRFYCEQDSGYSTGLPDRAIDAVRRAFAAERTGLEVKNTDGTVLPAFRLLPSFSRRNYLEIIVRVVRPDSEDEG